MNGAVRAHRNRLESILAADPSAVVYVPEFDQQEREADAEQAVKLASLAFKLRAECSESDAVARGTIAEGDPVLSLFSRTHPRIFENVTAADGGARALEALVGLARVRKHVEAGALGEEQATALASQYLIEKCSRPAEDAAPQ